MSCKVYALSTCPYCRMARKFLDDKGVTCDVVEVDQLEGEPRDQAIAEVKELSGGTSFPVIVFDDEVIVGFDKAKLKKLIAQ